MDFSLTADQQQLREEIIRFARRELNVGVVSRDRDQHFPRELWLKCGTMGLQGLPLPESFGGSDLDPLSCAIALEAFGYGCHDAGLVFSVCAHLLACAVPIWKFGTEEQKNQYLPGLADGTLIGVHCMTEADSGSDAFNLRTRAVLEDGGYRLNGSKLFASNGPVADVALVFAVTDPEKGYYGGITPFLVDTRAPGVRCTSTIEKMGLRTSPMGEVFFEDVRLPPTAALGGAVGGGAVIFAHSMDWERICLFATHLGTMERLLEQAATYAKSRIQFGRPIGDFQAVSHSLADMKVRLDAARLLVHRAAWRLGQGEPASLDAAIAKLFVSEALVESALSAVQMHGGYGYTVEYEVERALRDAVGSTLYSGTSQMQRNTIARWLGL